MIKRLLDAGMQFTEMSQSSADKLVRDLVHNGQLRRKDAEKTVQQLLERGRTTSEQLVATVQAEVNKQVARVTDRLDGIEHRLEELASKLGVGQPVAPAAPAKPDATEKAPVAKASAAKKAPAKKAAAATKAPAKKAPAGPSGVAKVATKKAAKP
jgi:polyhydroxyalkanoate synthesis regulator phasin